MPYIYPTNVIKTSVYLPEPLKDRLAELAQRSGRSEAELLRHAVERLVSRVDDQDGTRPAAVTVRRTGPLLVGVGVGPSAPDLITERALQVLRSAERIVAASTGPDAIGRAEAIVRAALPEVVIDRLTIDIGADADGRAASVAAAAEQLVGTLDGGEVVAFITLGDPNVYSIFPALAAEVAERRGAVPVEVVPGVMAFQELAARSHTVIAAEGEQLEVLTMGASGDDLDRLDVALGAPESTVVIYKGAAHLPAIAERLEASGRLDGAVLGELLGLPGERSVPVASASGRRASYLATVVVPAARPTA